MIAATAPRSLRQPRLLLGVMASAFSAYHGAAASASATTTNGVTDGKASVNGSQGQSFTVTALSRWSILDKTLPPVDKIKSLHVYDFDNTLFKTPLPNPTLWAGPTIGMLQSCDTFSPGGWWHDNRFLTATGSGVSVEEARGYPGWWNENVVKLVQLSAKQPDALCVLLTGRSERNFSDLIKRIAASRELDFDVAGLKPQVGPANQKFQSTMHFKQLFLDALMQTYKHAGEIRVYEDRPRHTEGFREFFEEWNRRREGDASRGPLKADVVQVSDESMYLDPVVEVAEVQHMINAHNDDVVREGSSSRKKMMKIKKTVFFTSYLVNATDSKRLLNLVTYPPNVKQSDIRHLGSSILICPRPCPANIMEKVGGIGSSMVWEVTGIGCHDNSVWAARVKPVPATAVYHTENPVPMVVLALRKGARPIDANKITTFKPVTADQAFMFQTTVGEKVILRIEADNPNEDAYESLFANKSFKRKHHTDDDFPKSGHNARGGGEARSFHSKARGGQARGRGGGGRGGARGRGGGRGGRGGGAYRSLDDVQPKNQAGGYGPPVEYDDVSRPPKGPSNGGSWAAKAAGANGTDLQNYY